MRRIFLAVLIMLPLQALADEVKTHSLTVQGSAITKVAPDLVSLPVTVREENPNVKIAKDKHDTKLRALLALAEETGIAKDKIQTSFTSVNPLYDYQDGTTKPHLRGYQVQTTLEFKLTDFSKLGGFVNSIIDAGIDDIGTYSYSLQDEAKVKDDTLMKAMDHAFDKASRLAATAKVTLDKPITIQEGDAVINSPMPPRPMPMRARGMMAMASVASAPQESATPPAGLIEVQQSVTVTYEIK